MVERAFVAGATGYTGRAVVKTLCALRVDVVAHVRPDSPSLPTWRQRFEAQGAVVDTTTWASDTMRTALHDFAPTVVFALLGTTRKRAAREGLTGNEGYEVVDYGLTHLLYQACRDAVPEARFVYLSSLGVREGTRNPYLSARARVERELREGAQPFTIARPSFITGTDREESRVGERVGAAVSDAMLSVAASLGARHFASRYRSMNATTLAAGLVRAAFDANAENTILDADKLR